MLLSVSILVQPKNLLLCANFSYQLSLPGKADRENLNLRSRKLTTVYWRLFFLEYNSILVSKTKKERSSCDLAIAIKILAVSEQVNAYLLGDYLFLGELSLDGNTLSAQTKF